MPLMLPAATGRRPKDSEITKQGHRHARFIPIRVSEHHSGLVRLHLQNWAEERVELGVHQDHMLAVIKRLEHHTCRRLDRVPSPRRLHRWRRRRSAPTGRRSAPASPPAIAASASRADPAQLHSGCLPPGMPVPHAPASDSRSPRGESPAPASRAAGRSRGRSRRLRPFRRESDDPASLSRRAVSIIMSNFWARRAANCDPVQISPWRPKATEC